MLVPRRHGQVGVFRPRNLKRTAVAAGLGLGGYAVQRMKSAYGKWKGYSPFSKSKRQITYKITKQPRKKTGKPCSASRFDSILIDRSRGTGRVLNANQNLNGTLAVDAWKASQLETAAANARFFDPAAPGTLATASLVSGTYQRHIEVSGFTKIHIRNNYQVPVKVRMYKLTPSSDTSIDPITAITNGLGDIGSPSATNCLTYPSDSVEFTKLWKIQKSVIKQLNPGAMLTMRHAVKCFKYEVALGDSQTATYQRRQGAHCYMIRVEGVIGHDSVADQQGTLPGGVDYSIDRVINFYYDAGASLKTVIVTDASDTMTTAGVLTLRPVADNVPYAVS